MIVFFNHSSSSSTLDSDAVAYCQRAGVTASDMFAKVSDLVKKLKSEDIWNRLEGAYIFAQGSNGTASYWQDLLPNGFPLVTSTASSLSPSQPAFPAASADRTITYSKNGAHMDGGDTLQRNGGTWSPLLADRSSGCHFSYFLQNDPFVNEGGATAAFWAFGADGTTNEGSSYYGAMIGSQSGMFSLWNCSETIPTGNGTPSSYTFTHSTAKGFYAMGTLGATNAPSITEPYTYYVRKDGIGLGTWSNWNPRPFPSRVHIGGKIDNSGKLASFHEISWFSFGEALTVEQADKLCAIVTNFNASINR